MAFHGAAKISPLKGPIVFLWRYMPRRCFGNLLLRSREIEAKVGAFSDRIEGLEVGGLVVVRIVGYDHLMTCVEPGSVLHIMQNSTSRISRWGRAFESRVRSFWRVRGDL